MSLTTDLRDRGVTYVDTPDVAAAELELARRALHHRLDDLARSIGREDVATLDTAIMDVETALMSVVNPDACSRCGLPENWTLKVRTRLVWLSLLVAFVVGAVLGALRR